ncbi:MAG TPA: TonB-dependent receptor [Bacteroidia bacterium]|jgi:vitamin B12 transporter|nr:TonB-dependent receptor [Bacteroidia bacterium]
MKKQFTSLLMVCLSFTGIYAQTKISGRILDGTKHPVTGANVYIKDSYDGTSTGPDGSFSFTAMDTGKAVLVASMITYEKVEKQVLLQGKDLVLNLVLKESANMLKTVVISAGTMEASDEKKVTILKPLDIVTTAGAQGDITGALKTLPGTQQVGESAGLFVRGGTGNETKTIIDGMVVANPYFTALPDVASRGRFSPFLFKGTVFSTGGYSAQYGQAMSSALVLETQDLPESSSATAAVSSVGVGAGINKLFKDSTTSMGADFNYTNLGPYYNLVPQDLKWTDTPVFWGGSLNFRKKTSETGILKFYGYANFSQLGMTRPDLDSTNGYMDNFKIKNQNYYTNLTYKDNLNDKWKYYIGASYSYNQDNLQPNNMTIVNTNSLAQGKLLFTRSIGNLTLVRFGGEFQNNHDVSDLQLGYYHPVYDITDNYTAGIAEADIFLSSKIVARIGGRYEYSSLQQKSNVAPRTSIAFKTSQNSQISLAYGEFYERPETRYLLEKQSLNYERATHYIINYQIVEEKRTFRIEAYYKNYENLVTTLPLPFQNLQDSLHNNGSGYAQGIDIFWRDKKTFRNWDYWVSYSYLDTKRQYINYPVQAEPIFATPHTASLVVKKFFPAILVNVGATYTYATGRPYYNPNNPVFLGDRTPDYNKVGLTASYVRRFGKAFTVFVIGVDNVLGTNNIYGYRYSADGQRSTPITATAARMYFVGIFMSFGIDRTQNVLDNN